MMDDRIFIAKLLNVNPCALAYVGKNLLSNEGIKALAIKLAKQKPSFKYRFKTALLNYESRLSSSM